MRSWIIIWIHLVSSLVLAGQEDKFFNALFQESGLPGLSVAILKNGQITFTGAYGRRSLDTREPVTARTVFSAASLSKPVFAYGVLKLVEAGRLDLDRPLHKYLPYPDIESDKRYRRITARLVLSHSAGFPNWRNGDLELLFPPGERYGYSGEGFVYLQRVVEAITGRPVHEWMAETVFAPLGMTRTSYVWEPRFEDDYAIPHGHRGETYPINSYAEGNTAYSLQTTARDYARFLQALLRGKGLSERTVREMLAPQVQAGVTFQDAEPLSETIAWGLGVGLEKSGGGTRFWQWGDNGPFKAFFMADADSGDGFVYFANSSDGLTVAPAIAERVLGGPHPVFSWISYGTYDAPARRLERALLDSSFEQAIAPFLDAGGAHQDTMLISERAMNALGYRFMDRRRYQDARRLFRLNMNAYPHSANVYDSYAEACLRSGDRDGAAEYYARAAALNPDNEVAAAIARQLTTPATGNTTFTLRGYPDARLVILAGSFNGWSEWKNLLRRRNGVWECRLDLEPGTYQYKFIIDGVWILDPANPESTYDGNHNSVLIVK